MIFLPYSLSAYAIVPTPMLAIDRVRSLRPAGQMPDSISWLGGRQQLTAGFLAEVLGVYFNGQIERGSDHTIIHILAPTRTGLSASFSGATDAVIEDHKFSLVVTQPARCASLTLGTDESLPVRDFDALLGVLADMWPEGKAAR